MMALSPGPWRVMHVDRPDVVSFWAVEDAAGRYVATPRQEDDARAIAALPELLSECRDFVANYQEGKDMSLEFLEIREILARIEGKDGA